MKQTELANALRILAMDAVEAANSGHPGMPMGMADIAEVLWNHHLSHSPNHPDWPNRDRFVLSNGHGSMLLYSLLHLSGYNVSLDDLKQFRQLHSPTPGHPEYGEAPGVETTTGPLGQGIANAVGFAMAEKHLAATFNQPNFALVDHYTYAFVGDGCLMEGISHEVCSLAGTQRLGKLIVFWDDNGISIDGPVDGWFNENTCARFTAYNWQVIENVDGHDANAISNAIDAAKADSSRPTLIACRTQIAFGAPNVAGSSKSHGAPLGKEEIAATRKQLNWPNTEPFVVPESIYQSWDAKDTGQKLEQEWQALFSTYQTKYPELASEWQRRMTKALPDNWPSVCDSLLKQFQNEAPKLATRKASQVCLNTFAPALPEMIGGSADLTCSNLTRWTDADTFLPNKPGGRYIDYGVREFGMSAIANGLALYGGLLPYVGTFLTFSDYARNAVRMAALMRQRCVFVYTHDSIGLGEDGPTHQPIEHITMLRATPNLLVFRPCDAYETAVAWQLAIESQETPSALLLSRQGLVMQETDSRRKDDIQKGGYILKDLGDAPSVILIATGSEVELAMQAAKQLFEAGTSTRVVSMPCIELFHKQSDDYKEKVLPQFISKRVAIEAGSSLSWYQFVPQGRIIGIDTFGASAPAGQLFEHFGFTPENIVATVASLQDKN